MSPKSSVNVPEIPCRYYDTEPRHDPVMVGPEALPGGCVPPRLAGRMRAQLPGTLGGRVARGRPPFGPPTSAFPALQRHCSARTSAIARIPGHRCDFQRSPSALPVPCGSHVRLPSPVRLGNRLIPRLRMSNSTIPTTFCLIHRA